MAPGPRVDSMPPGARTETLQGIAGSPGVAIGAAVVMGGHRDEPPAPPRRLQRDQGGARALRGRASSARRTSCASMAKRIGDHRAEASILEAYC